MDSIIKSINKQMSICDVLSTSTILRKEENLVLGECPFCLSNFLVAHEGENIYHCFGCGRGGGVAQLKIDLANGFIEELHQYVPERYPEDVVNTAKRKSKKYLDIYEECTSFFIESMKENYLMNRGVDGYTIQEYRIGYADPNGKHVEYLLSLGYTRDDLSYVGLINQHGYPTFKDRIMFPIQNELGETIAFTGRVRDDSVPKYLNSPKTRMYNKSRSLYGIYQAFEGIQRKKEVYIVEGQMDTLAFHMHGIENIVGVSGTALTDDHARLFSRWGVERIVLAFDMDDAGKKAINRSVEILTQYFPVENIWVAEFPGAKDASEFFQLTSDPYTNHSIELTTYTNYVNAKISGTQEPTEGIQEMEEYPRKEKTEER